jgi:hypothetical protein
MKQNYNVLSNENFGLKDELESLSIYKQKTSSTWNQFKDDLENSKIQIKELLELETKKVNFIYRFYSKNYQFNFLIYFK